MDKQTLIQNIKMKYGVVGKSPTLNRALYIATQVAPLDLSVLIVGESGVGKEIIPKIIHDNSVRKHNKFFAINCGSIPEGTIDSELFGHEKGAFTGAIGEREGYYIRLLMPSLNCQIPTEENWRKYTVNKGALNISLD